MVFIILHYYVISIYQICAYKINGQLQKKPDGVKIYILMIVASSGVLDTSFLEYHVLLKLY